MATRFLGAEPVRVCRQHPINFPQMSCRIESMASYLASVGPLVPRNGALFAEAPRLSGNCSTHTAYVPRDLCRPDSNCICFPRVLPPASQWQPGCRQPELFWVLESSSPLRLQPLLSIIKIKIAGKIGEIKERVLGGTSFPVHHGIILAYCPGASLSDIAVLMALLVSVASQDTGTSTSPPRLPTELKGL